MRKFAQLHETGATVRQAQTANQGHKARKASGGAQGVAGLPGRDGRDGLPGPKGDSVTKVEIEPGNLLAVWVGEIKTLAGRITTQRGVPGERGPQGPAGPQGAKGRDGKDGKNGKSVTKVELNGRDLFVWLDGVKKKAGSISFPSLGGQGGRGGSFYSPYYEKQVVVRSPAEMAGTLRSDVVYFIDGVIDFSGTGYAVTVPAGGLNLRGHAFDVSVLKCTDENYTLFTSAQGGSGNVTGRDYSLEVTGAGSKVYDLEDATGDSSVETSRVNYNGCASLGEINGYRQVLEDGTGRFGGTPELTLSGTWAGGYRVTTSIVRGTGDLTALFKAGTGLVINGRFLTDVNCDLPAVGALFDFSESNFANDESLLVRSATVTRQGVIDATDATIHPNIDQNSIKSSWSSNTGMPNTVEYLKARCTVEAATVIAAADVYYPVAGTFTLDVAAHLSMPANGEFELDTGEGTFLVSGNVSLDGTANDVLDLRVTKSTDGGSTWPVQVDHLRRVVNNLTGARDVAFFPVSFVVLLKKGDRIRFEIENKTAGRDVTMELDSYITVTES